jgi:uncharacterized phiE125 gp8 family phage protein
MQLKWHGRVNAQATAAPMPASAISAADLAEHLRVTASDELPLIDGYAKAATATVERRLNRLLVRRAVEIRAAALPFGRCSAVLYGGAVETVTTFTVDGVAVPDGDYQIVGDSPAALVPTTDWPQSNSEGLPVRIVYTAGFDQVPYDIRVALLLIGADMFENRTQHVVGTSVGVNPAVDALLMPWRIAPV